MQSFSQFQTLCLALKLNFENISSSLSKSQKFDLPSQKGCLAGPEYGNACTDEDLGSLPTATFPLDALFLMQGRRCKGSSGRDGRDPSSTQVVSYGLV